MSRSVRQLFEGAVYHVTSRGNRQGAIYDDEADRRIFLELVGESMIRMSCQAYAYCLMGNHYHMVVLTPRANLPQLMRHINGVYTQRYNWRHKTSGHVFQGRYYASLVDRDAYLLEACRYVDLNPVRAKLVERPQEWYWSSYRAHAGLALPPSWLLSQDLHAILGQGSDKESAARYQTFVAQGVGRTDTALGSRSTRSGTSTSVFSKQMQATAPSPLPLSSYFDRFPRDEAIVRAFREGSHSMTAIAETAQLSLSTISRVIRQAGGDAD